MQLLALVAGNILEFEAEVHDQSRCEGSRYGLFTAAHHPARKTFNGGAEFTIQELYLCNGGQWFIGAHETLTGHTAGADVYYLRQNILVNGQHIFIHPVTRVLPSLNICRIHSNPLEVSNKLFNANMVGIQG